MRIFKWIACLTVVLALFAVEAAYFLDDYSPWRRYAALCWIISSVAIVLSTWRQAFTAFFDPQFWRLPHRAWYLVAFLLPPVLILVNAGGTYFTHIDAEGLQQLAAGMDLAHNDFSLGVYRMGYFTYLARQYVLNCLPTYIYGPSLWAARVGNSMFYIGSYLFFLSALVTYFRRKRASDPLFFASYCGIMIAFGQYTLLNARKFEQTMMPIGITLFFLAALVLFLAEPKPLTFLWVTWAFGFFAQCYTPALGSFGLALAILLYLIIRLRRRILIPTVAYGIATLLVAYLVVKKAEKGALGIKFSVGIERFTASDRVMRYLHGVRSVIGSDFALIPAPLALAILAALYLAWRYREYRYAAICLWSAAMAYASLTFVGSNLNFPSHDIHRAMIIIPPLTLGAVLLLLRYVSESPGAHSTLGTIRFFLSLSMVYMVFTGVCVVFLVRSFFALGMEEDYDEVFAKVNQVIHTPGAPRLMRIYLVPPLEIDMESGLRYFAPGAVVIRAVPPVGEKFPGTYVFSYFKRNAADRFDDEVVPSRHPRPFIKMAEE